MEERYEAEIRKLNKEMQAYRSTITKLTAKHDGYNHIIQLFESKLQLMAKHVENLQNKSQLKVIVLKIFLFSILRYLNLSYSYIKKKYSHIHY